MDPQRAIGWAALLGLAVGSGLAGVVVQLPLRLAYDWKNQARALRRGPPLVSPRPSLWPCGWRFMRAGVGARWGPALKLTSSTLPIIITTALLFAACAWRWGPTLAALCAMGLSAGLVTLAWIDARSGLLPDVVTLPLLWLGLLLSCLSVFTSPRLAILGALGSYLFLWALYQIFWWVTRREGMGYGDFKVLAAIGAWLGVDRMPWVLLLACLVSLPGAVWRIWRRQVPRDQPQPFGPYLALAGIMVLLGY